MNRSKQSQLFGVKHPMTTSIDGALNAYTWAKLRAGDNHGHFNDDKGALIFWFGAPDARDEFHHLFGGLKVTLHRREEKQHVGKKAIALLKGQGK